MVRPLAPEGERKDVSLQVRATRNDVEEIKACISQEIQEWQYQI